MAPVVLDGGHPVCVRRAAFQNADEIDVVSGVGLNRQNGRAKILEGEAGVGQARGAPFVLLDALNDSGEGQPSLQMIDSTIVRAHQHAAGAQRRNCR